jgi:hypothetical protein
MVLISCFNGILSQLSFSIERKIIFHFEEVLKVIYTQWDEIISA